MKKKIRELWAIGQITKMSDVIWVTLKNKLVIMRQWQNNSKNGKCKIKGKTKRYAVKKQILLSKFK